MYMQQKKKHKTSRQAKEKVKKQRKHIKGQTNERECGANKHVIKQTCYQAKEGVLEGQM